VLYEKVQPQSAHQRLEIHLLHPREEGSDNYILKSFLRGEPKEGSWTVKELIP
jgi:hypothetical protein